MLCYLSIKCFARIFTTKEHRNLAETASTFLGNCRKFLAFFGNLRLAIASRSSHHRKASRNGRKLSKNHEILSLFFFLTNRLVGDVLLATGFLSYLGPFNQNFRNLLLSRWEKEMSANKIPFSENLNLISMLTDAATVGVDLPYDILFI